MGADQYPAGGLQGVALMLAIGILLHGFGQRYDLPASLALYLFAAGAAAASSPPHHVGRAAGARSATAGWGGSSLVGSESGQRSSRSSCSRASSSPPEWPTGRGSSAAWPLSTQR